MQAQNQFISPQQLAELHLRSLLPAQPNLLHCALEATNRSSNSVQILLTQGHLSIPKQSFDCAQLLQNKMTDSQKRLLKNKRTYEEKKEIEYLLFRGKDNNKKVNQEGQSSRVFSIEKHMKFVQQMKQSHRQRQETRLNKLNKQQENKQSKEKAEQQSNEKTKIQSIEKRKQQIKQNLQKMRQNHQKMLQSEHESRQIFNMLRKKKRLYQNMKQLQDQNELQLHRQHQERMKKHREESKLNKEDLIMHEKQYMEKKKERGIGQESRTRINKIKISNNYSPPGHSSKINKFLEEEERQHNKYQSRNKQIQEKIQKIAQYSSRLKERFKQEQKRHNTVHHTPVSSRQRSLQNETKNDIDRVKLGNDYMKQAKMKSCKRAKTEEKYFNPQQNTSKQITPRKEKTHTTYLGDIPQHKRRALVQKMKRAEIQKILSPQPMSEGDRLLRIKLADQKLSIELKKKEEEMKGRYSAQASEDALALLLGTIRAKINLIDSI